MCAAAAAEASVGNGRLREEGAEEPGPPGPGREDDEHEDTRQGGILILCFLCAGDSLSFFGECIVETFWLQNARRSSLNFCKLGGQCFQCGSLGRRCCFHSGRLHHPPAGAMVAKHGTGL